MKKIKNWIALATLLAMAGTSANSINAQEYYSDTGGYGYQDAWSSPALAPSIALGTVAIIAIVAVAIRHGHSSHSHGHSGSSH
jgi:hypothetical protein